MFKTTLSKIMERSFGVAIFVGGILLLTPCVLDAASLRLAWNANGEEDLGGYRLYYGRSPHSYGSSVDVGDCTTYELAQLDQGVTYYIAVSALDTSHNESEKSNETSGVARDSESCTDGIDNDGNGYADCEDPACNSEPVCLGSRVGGELVLYTFEEGMDTTVNDLSAVGAPLNLTIADESAISWIPDGGLAINASVLIDSGLPATKVIDAVKTSNEITIEAWLAPDNTTQNGPVRIVTLSSDPGLRNFTLGQQFTTYDIRLRTTATTANGTPSLSSLSGSLTTALTHVVYTRDASGVATIYINGAFETSGTVSGDCSNWDDTFLLGIGNERTGDRPWFGELYLIALYDRALSQLDVEQNFLVGLSLDACSSDPDCDDGNLCTDDSCLTGQCLNQCNATDSGDPCCTDPVCVADPVCINFEIVCDDDIDNNGDGDTDCLDTDCEGLACDDGNPCTENDTCTAGLCAGTPLNCEDGNICTDDSCDPLSGCMYDYNTAPCDDGLFCNGSDTCNAGSCFLHAGDPCQERHCNEEDNICEDLGIISDTQDLSTTSTGRWNLSVGFDAFEGSALVSQKKATYTWTADLFQSGYYEIYMWWRSLPGSCSNCPVRVSCGEALLETVSVDQMYNGGQWNLIGTYEFEAGETCSVTIRSEGSGCKTCADAVKFVYSGEFLPEAGIDFMYPNPARIEDEVCFEGHGISGEGRTIEDYSWVSDRDGELSNDSAFCVSSLSAGTHQMSLRVKDDTEVWSVPVSEALYVGEIAITCDNGESCTSKTGKWKAVETLHAYRGTLLASSKNATYTWTPDLLQTGFYEIYMWWDAALVNCDSCPVTLTCGGEVLDTLLIDQRQDGGQWNLLGTYELATGNGCSVTILSEGGIYSRTAADAVRFVFTDNLPDSQTLFFQ